jgi:DNA-binding response OmpR family regulator
MKKILMVTDRKENFHTFMDALSRAADTKIEIAASADAALAAASETTPDLVVNDETVGGTPGLKIARSILMKNAMINQAVVSPLSPEDFHEASEGLGLMAQLSPTPDAEEARKLMEMLSKMP